jgi:CubicO group peptidase (beta-lactamase class C family)
LHNYGNASEKEIFMPLNSQTIEALMQNHSDFSGVVAVRKAGTPLFGAAYGYANRSDELPNILETRFGIASGTKLLTGVAICQLVEQGKLSFETRLSEVLDFPFPNFDPAVNMHHLLTHTSGVPDYFDEETQDDYGALWKERPNYSMISPRDFLPMFQNLPMKFPPSEKFQYNNGAFVLLGLIIEAVTGQGYTDYIEQHILQVAGMADSGFFPLNQLPARTALGYLPMENGTWRSNIYETPIIGGADGGIFVTAGDVGRFWDALFKHRLLSPAMTSQYLTPHAIEDETYAYGYGIWIVREGEKILRYAGVGADPGVSFASTVFPEQELEITAISNLDDGVWDVYEALTDLVDS